MVKTKKSSRVAQRHEMIDAKTEDLLPAPVSGNRMKSVRWILLALLVLGVGFFLVKKGHVVAAVVNGQPIFRWELNKNLQTRFGEQTLESMITERLIAGAAQKEGIVITQADVDTKVETITKTLGPNVNLEELLKYQGMTRADFEQQVRLQLTVEKVLGKDLTLAESEIDTFVQENKETMTATDEAALRTEARDAILSQKISEKMQPWLAELRESAKITKLF